MSGRGGAKIRYVNEFFSQKGYLIYVFRLKNQTTDGTSEVCIITGPPESFATKRTLQANFSVEDIELLTSVFHHFLVRVLVIIIVPTIQVLDMIFFKMTELTLNTTFLLHLPILTTVPRESIQFMLPSVEGFKDL